MRVRGLKPDDRGQSERSTIVAPRAGAWIETSQYPSTVPRPAESHPVRVRGLKLPSYWLYRFRQKVAPRAGAWIETLLLLTKVT